MLTTENIDVICIISHFQTDHNGDLGFTSTKNRYLTPLNLARGVKYGVQGVGGLELTLLSTEEADINCIISTHFQIDANRDGRFKSP